MSKIVYLASPYTHPDPKVREENFRKVSVLAADMNSKGIVALSPITYGHTLLEFKEMPHDWAFWENFCISFLQHCDEIAVYKMPGWEKSKGVAEELKYAEENGINITYIEYEEEIKPELSKILDKYGNEIRSGDELGVQDLPQPVPVYEKDGELYFNPYGKEERVRDYFMNDIYLL